MRAAPKRAGEIAIGSGVALLAGPTGADAHLVTSGLGPVYDGLLHLLVTPENLIGVVALALLAGARGVVHGRRALFVLPAAWMVGGIVGLAVHGRVSLALMPLSFVLLGGLVAADVRLSVSVMTALAALLGLGHGYLDGATMDQPGLGASALLGSVAAVFGLVALTASLVVTLQTGWPRIVVRVAGSWIAAIGLLLLGWGFRPGA